MQYSCYEIIHLLQFTYKPQAQQQNPKQNKGVVENR